MKPHLQRVVEVLSGLLGADENEITVEPLSLRGMPDLVFRTGRSAYVVAHAPAGSAAHLSAAIGRLKSSRRRFGRKAILVVAAPRIGNIGREMAEREGVSWLDLSGNAHIVGPGTRVHVEGKPGLPSARGRPASVFAPRSARIARFLLVNAGEAFTQRALARATGLDEGFVSRIVRRLVDDGLLSRLPDGAIEPRDPSLLLDAWREAHDFTRNEIVRGLFPSRSGEGLLKEVAGILAGSGVEHAATGLGAAWLHARFAGFSTVTFYAGDRAALRSLRSLGFSEEPRGANLWMVIPLDDGVFLGSGETDGVRCVHPVQACLDLSAHPERAAEAAMSLRAKIVASWRGARA